MESIAAVWKVFQVSNFPIFAEIASSSDNFTARNKDTPNFKQTKVPSAALSASGKETITILMEFKRYFVGISLRNIGSSLNCMLVTKEQKKNNKKMKVRHVATSLELIYVLEIKIYRYNFYIFSFNQVWEFSIYLEVSVILCDWINCSDFIPRKYFTFLRNIYGWVPETSTFFHLIT